MYEEEITEAIKELFKISALLTNLKHRIAEYQKEGYISVPTDKYFDYLLDERRSARNVDLQFNNANDCNVLPADKEQDMNLNIPGISINSRPRKDGRWQGQILHDGVRYYVYGRTREAVANKIKFYLQHGLPRTKKRKSSNVYGVPETFNAFAMYYFENFRKKKVAEYTLKQDLARYNKYLLPYFNEKPIKKISPLECQKLIDDISEQGKGKTADEIFGILSVIFKMAIKHNVIVRNPLDVVLHIKHEHEHGTALTKEEENLLKESLKDSQFLPVFMLALYTGLRPNEIKTARIENGFVVAVNSKRKNKKVEYKKIPICKMLAPYLEKPLIFTSELYMREKFKKILPNHRLYDLRTTFYSRLKECGVSDTAIKLFVGHSLGALGNAYTCVSDEFLKREMEKFEY